MTVGMAAALGAKRLDTTTAIRTDNAIYDMTEPAETGPLSGAVIWTRILMRS